MSWSYRACRYLIKLRNFSVVNFTMDLTTDAAKHVELTIASVKEIVPKMTFDLHKGQSGRIGVIGGSKE